MTNPYTPAPSTPPRGPSGVSDPSRDQELREKALIYTLSYVEHDDEFYTLHEVLRGAGEVYDFLVEGTLPRVQDGF